MRSEWIFRISRCQLAKSVRASSATSNRYSFQCARAASLYEAGGNKGVDRVGTRGHSQVGPADAGGRHHRPTSEGRCRRKLFVATFGRKKIDREKVSPGRKSRYF